MKKKLRKQEKDAAAYQDAINYISGARDMLEQGRIIKADRHLEAIQKYLLEAMKTK